MFIYCRSCGQPINIKDKSDIFNPNLICPHCGQRVFSGKNFCYNCGKPTFPGDRVCINCGASLVKPANWGITLILAITLGYLGAHRFYTRNYLTGFLQFITVGGLGIWVIIDIIRLLTGDFKDGDGFPVRPNFIEQIKKIKF